MLDLDFYDYKITETGGEEQKYECFFYDKILSSLEDVNFCSYIGSKSNKEYITLKSEKWVSDKKQFTQEIEEKSLELSKKNMLGQENINQLEKEKMLKSYGWKIHISIDDKEDEDIKNAWNCLVPVFIKHGIGLIKIYKAHLTKDDLWCEKNKIYGIGKRFTIYAVHNMPQEEKLV